MVFVQNSVECTFEGNSRCKLDCFNTFDGEKLQIRSPYFLLVGGLGTVHLLWFSFSISALHFRKYLLGLFTPPPPPFFYLLWVCVCVRSFFLLFCYLIVFVLLSLFSLFLLPPPPRISPLFFLITKTLVSRIVGGVSLQACTQFSGEYYSRTFARRLSMIGRQNKNKPCEPLDTM